MTVFGFERPRLKLSDEHDTIFGVMLVSFFLKNRTYSLYGVVVK